MKLRLRIGGVGVAKLRLRIAPCFVLCCAGLAVTVGSVARAQDTPIATNPFALDVSAGSTSRAARASSLPDRVQSDPDRAQSEPDPARSEPAQVSSAAPQTSPPDEAGDAPDAAPLPAGEIDLFDIHIADGVRFRPGSGLSVDSDDGQFGLTTRVRVQLRYGAEVEQESWGHELTLRRARLAFGGHFFGEDNRFKLELALSPRDMGIRDVFESEGPERTPLLDWYLEFRQLRDLNVRVGQYKVPFSRQRVISSGDLQMVDRSIVNSEFNLDRDVGVDFRSRDLLGLGHLRYYAGVYIGQGRDAVGLDDAGLMYIGRLEVLPFGLFDDYEEADFSRSLTPRLSLGAGWAAIDRAHGERGILGGRPADGGTTNTQHFTADAIFMYGGLSLLSEVMIRVGQRNPGEATDEAGAPVAVAPPSNGWGLMAQAGYLLPGLPVEIAARYGTTQPMGAQTSMRERHELGLAASYYFARHPFKLQLDAFQLWEDRFDAGTTRIRVQLQASL